MDINKLISKLCEIRDKYGNLDIVTTRYTENTSYIYLIDEDDLLINPNLNTLLL